MGNFSVKCKIYDGWAKSLLGFLYGDDWCADGAGQWDLYTGWLWT